MDKAKRIRMYKWMVRKVRLAQFDQQEAVSSNDFDSYADAELAKHRAKCWYYRQVDGDTRRCARMFGERDLLEVFESARRGYMTEWGDIEDARRGRVPRFHASRCF